MSSTEVFEENWEGKKEKQWSTNLCEKSVTEKASSNQMRTGMLLRRQTSDTKLPFKYSVYSNYEIQYKNRDIY